MAKVQPRDPKVPADFRTRTAGVEGRGRSRILTINGGSSSLKFALFERIDPSAWLLSGQFDRIGLKDARWATAHAGGGRNENAPEIRRRICAGLEFLGIELDEARNASSGLLISTDQGPVKVRVIRTDEELIIARATARPTAQVS